MNMTFPVKPHLAWTRFCAPAIFANPAECGRITSGSRSRKPERCQQSEGVQDFCGLVTNLGRKLMPTRSRCVWAFYVTIAFDHVKSLVEMKVREGSTEFRPTSQTCRIEHCR